jgi:hypothetical protein
LDFLLLFSAPAGAARFLDSSAISVGICERVVMDGGVFLRMHFLESARASEVENAWQFQKEVMIKQSVFHSLASSTLFDERSRVELKKKSFMRFVQLSILPRARKKRHWWKINSNNNAFPLSLAQKSSTPTTPLLRQDGFARYTANLHALP